MKRHFIAYMIVIGIYYLPAFFMSPGGSWYFVSIGCWSTISIIVYLKLIRLRCATLLAVIEAMITVCAIMALIEFTKRNKDGYFYTNIESLTDMFVILELMIITFSLIGTTIGHLGHNRYNTLSGPNSHYRADVLRSDLQNTKGNL